MNELDRFKTEINLVGYAASHGYTEFDRNKSSKTCIVLRRPTDDGKIAVTRGLDQHWVYYDFRECRGGSLLDFVMRHLGYNLGQARKTLRNDFTIASHPFFHTAPFYTPRPAHKDLHKIACEYADTHPVNHEHPYLAERRISPKTILTRRFYGTVKMDSRLNICFPYFALEGLVGLEKRNRSFMAYSEGGCKGLWRSNLAKGDRKAIIFESPIDALSYAMLFDDLEDRTRYFATGGQIGRNQWELIDALVEKYEEMQISIVLAFDNDPAGRKYVQLFLERFHRYDLTIDLPSDEGSDWNDVLRDSLKKR